MSSLLQSSISELSNEQVIELAVKFAWNNELGCYTRPALEFLWMINQSAVEWIIVFDIDKMKQMNSSGSWENTSRILKEALNLRSTDYVLGQLLSGDEFVVLVTKAEKRAPTCPITLCERIQTNLKQRGASATFSYGKPTSVNFSECVLPIQSLVEIAKKADQRGQIFKQV